MVVVENTFNRAKFEAGKIYFLNTQKLSKNSLLVRGHDQDELEVKAGSLLPETRPDLRSHTIWDTVRNTIEDPDLTLYLVLDEAHRGMGNPSKAAESAKSTIVQRLINGASGVPGIPVVWGISATVERFTKAMEGAQKRITLPPVAVDSTKVQESGLIKDTIILDIPDETGDFDTVLVRRATDKLKASTDAWAEYAKQQDETHTVIPLMVLQVPNTPDPNDIGRALDTIYQQWPDLPSGSVAHVLGDHTTQQFGNRNVPHISPERVQESTWVRVLIAKDAISTGWDCPRAEVMVSFRAAVEQYGIVRPDFMFFSIDVNGTVVADIVDPHGFHLVDALPKLKGLALYAETHAKAYRRIESIAEVKGKLRKLDLKSADVRKGIADATDAESLFSGGLAKDY